jgi:hypothetical protein
MKPAKRTRKPAAAEEASQAQAAAAAAPEKPPAEAPESGARDETKALWLNAEVRIDHADKLPAQCVETDLRSYIHFLERKYGLTIHAIDYQKRSAGEYVKAVTTLGPETKRGGDWFALAS